MSAPLAPFPADYYLVTFGKNAALGSFQTNAPLALRRGERVVLRTARGLEVGDVVRPASVQQSRLIGHAGAIVRRVDADDARRQELARDLGDRLFAQARACCQRDRLPIHVLDVDVSLDAAQAILLLTGPSDVDLSKLVHELSAAFGCKVLVDNLSAGGPAQEDDHGHGGCGKPDCGQGEGGCSSCGSGGGCKTGCGDAGVDLRDYFSNLRDQMTKSNRVPLV